MDTSTELGSVAVVVESELRSEIAARVRARHGETLLPLIEEALSHAGLARADIDLLATGIGPGSFTGTRIGVATAKGLAIALDRPLMGVVSLTAIARAAPGRLVVPIVDAHKGEVYLSVHERPPAGNSAGTVERLGPIHAPPAEAAARVRELTDQPLVLVGSGLRRYPELIEALAPAEILPPLFDAPRAAVIAMEAEACFQARGADDRAALEPLYVRPSDAVLPR